MACKLHKCDDLENIPGKRWALMPVGLRSSQSSRWNLLHFVNRHELIRGFSCRFLRSGCVRQFVHREPAFCGGGCPQLDRHPICGAKAYRKQASPITKAKAACRNRIRKWGEIIKRRVRKIHSRLKKAELVLIEITLHVTVAC